MEEEKKRHPYADNNFKWTEPEALKLANDMLAWFKAEETNIFFDDFLFIQCNEKKYAGKIYPQLPMYLSNRYESFKEIYNKCRKIEEVKLKSLATTSKINTKMATFLLSASFGYTEKTQQTVTVRNTQVMNIDPFEDKKED